MREERCITIDGQPYSVMISDEQEALLAAHAAGGALVGLWDEKHPEWSLAPAEYVVESLGDVTEEFLERVVLRKLGRPWVICETDRLVVREFEVADASQVPKEKTWQKKSEEQGNAEDSDDFEELENSKNTENLENLNIVEYKNADSIFYDKDKLQAYIDSQYRFYEYGIWALVDKSSGKLIGKAGIFNGEDLPEEGLEIGYHVFEPYRKQGYAFEACEGILKYAAEQLSVCQSTSRVQEEMKRSTENQECGEREDELRMSLYAKIDPSNEVSIHLAKKLGFELTARKYTESTQSHDLYVWSCSQSPEV